MYRFLLVASLAFAVGLCGCGTNLPSGASDADATNLVLDGTGAAPTPSPLFKVESPVLVPTFSSGELTYTLSYGASATAVNWTVTVTSSDPNATIQVSLDGGSLVPAVSDVALVFAPPGSQVFDVVIIVTAENGVATKTYTVTVTGTA